MGLDVELGVGDLDGAVFGGKFGEGTGTDVGEAVVLFDKVDVYVSSEDSFYLGMAREKIADLFAIIEAAAIVKIGAEAAFGYGDERVVAGDDGWGHSVVLQSFLEPLDLFWG